MDNEKILDELKRELMKTYEDQMLLTRVIEKLMIQGIENQFEKFVLIDDMPKDLYVER